MSKKLNSKWKDIAIRAGKTFLQAFLGSITVDITTMNADSSVWRSMLLAASAAGISAVMNSALAALNDDYD